MAVAPTPALATPAPLSWWRTALGAVQNHLTTFVATTLVALLTVFSGYITEGVKSALNRADARTGKYESLAAELSNFVFTVELVHEFLEHNWTTLPTLEWLIGDYNKAITNLRKNEYVYLQWLNHYWGTDRVKEFDEIMKQAKAIDVVIHSLNDELELVVTKKKDKVDAGKASEAAKKLQGLLKDLQEKTKNFLIKLR